MTKTPTPRPEYIRSKEKVKKFSESDAKIKRMTYAIIGGAGNCENLASRLGISVITLRRRLQDPGTLRLSEMRKLKEIGKEYEVNFSSEV